MALAYARLGVQEIEHFEELPPQYDDGTCGQVFGMDKDFNPRSPAKPPDPFARE